jgi:hypothetical protein
MYMGMAQILVGLDLKGGFTNSMIIRSGSEIIYQSIDYEGIQFRCGRCHVFKHLLVRNLRAMVVKVDLSKAYDRVSWLYIRVVLIHLGFSPCFLSWVMNCITSVSFVIHINGASSPFFKPKRRLR